jgi:hypothetical protein
MLSNTNFKKADIRILIFNLHFYTIRYNTQRYKENVN